MRDAAENHILGLWPVEEQYMEVLNTSGCHRVVARRQGLERSCLLEIGAVAESGRAAGMEGVGGGSEFLPNRASRVQLRPFEVEIERRVQHLQEVCRSPRMHLTTEIEKVRASSARRVPVKACEYLAAHSEDWQQRSFRTIRPRRVLSLLVEDLYDIYENRVAVRLIDRLLEYVGDRLQDLRKLAGVINEAKQYQSDCAGNFRKEHRLFTELGELYSDQEHDRALSTLQFLEALERKLLALCASDLYRAVPQRAQVPVSLRETNILANDQHYRHVAYLWRSWAEWYQHRVRTKAQVHEESQRICTSFEAYVALLVSKSLSNFGFGAIEDISPNPGSNPVLLNGPWGTLN